jgi:hypothetical protein
MAGAARCGTSSGDDRLEVVMVAPKARPDFQAEWA